MNQDPSELTSFLDDHPGAALTLLQPPIAVNPLYIDISGSLTAGFLLSALCQIEQDQGDPLNPEIAAISSSWMPYSISDIHEKFKLTEKEQRNARSKLITRGLIHERRVDYPAKLQVQINHGAITQALMKALKTDPTNVGQSSEATVH